MHYPRDTLQMRTDTPLGPVRLAASAQGLVGLWFEGQRHEPTEQLYGARAWPGAQASTPAQWAHVQQAATELDEYLQGQRQCFAVAVDLRAGTAFQQAVWQALLGLPVGHTCTYGALARQIGNPAAVRAVGAAVGRNPVSVIVPCHRVLGGDGSLTGYAGGLDRKAALLRREGAWPQPSLTNPSPAPLKATA